jgi:hypothetical protein
MTDHHATGQCRCGKVQFEISSAPLVTMACHCRGCQRMTGSAFSLSTLYSSEGFRVTVGEAVIGGLHGTTRHYFCDHCKSWLFTRPQGMDQFVNVRSTMMEDVSSYRPFLETQTSEKLPWATTSAVHSFEKFPTAEQFPALMAEFAARASG